MPSAPGIAAPGGLSSPARTTLANVIGGGAALVMDALEDATLAPDTVRVAAGHPATASLGAMFGAIAVEKV